MINRAIVLFPGTINKIYIRIPTSMKTKPTDSNKHHAFRCVQPGMWVSWISARTDRRSLHCRAAGHEPSRAGISNSCDVSGWGWSWAPFKMYMVLLLQLIKSYHNT